MRRILLGETALLPILRPALPPSSGEMLVLQKVLALQRVYLSTPKAICRKMQSSLAHEHFQKLIQSADTVNVNLRKHQTANPLLRSSRLGVSCPHFSRCKAAFVTPHARVARSEFRFASRFRRKASLLSQLAIFEHLRLPRMDHFGGLPCTPKQIADRLPVFYRESESDSVLPRKEVHAPFLVV